MKADPKVNELFEGMEKPNSTDGMISAYAQVAETLFLSYIDISGVIIISRTQIMKLIGNILQWYEYQYRC